MSGVKLKLVVVAPRWPGDVATWIWAPFLNKAVRRLIAENEFEPVVLYADDANRRKFWEALSDTAVRGVLGVGHGGPSVFTGQRLERLLTVDDPLPPALASGGFFPVSCLVGRNLCPTLVAKGAVFAIGNVQEYWFTAQRIDNNGEDFDEDALLKYYLHCEYRVLLRLLLVGVPTGQAFDEMKRAYEEKAREAAAVDYVTSWCLAYDGLHRMFFGDRNWVMVPTVVKTATEVRCEGYRDPYASIDRLRIEGSVRTERGEGAPGSVKVTVRGDGFLREEVIPLEGGSFSLSVVAPVPDNRAITYTVVAEYPGFVTRERVVYAPSSASTSLTVHPVKLRTSIKVESVRARAEELHAVIAVRGRLIDETGRPLSGKQVSLKAAAVGYPYSVAVTVTTDGDGRFEATLSLPGQYFRRITYEVSAEFAGDAYFYSSAAAERVPVTFLPKLPLWVKILAAAVLAALLFLALAPLLF